MAKHDHWQKQADHFAAIKAAADAVIADPNSTAEEVAEATATSADMAKNLKRLLDKYGVSPSGA